VNNFAGNRIPPVFPLDEDGTYFFRRIFLNFLYFLSNAPKLKNFKSASNNLKCLHFLRQCKMYIFSTKNFLISNTSERDIGFLKLKFVHFCSFCFVKLLIFSSKFRNFNASSTTYYVSYTWFNNF